MNTRRQTTTLSEERRFREVGQLFRDPARQMNQQNAQSSNSAGGQSASPMWRADKNQSLNTRPRLENQRAANGALDGKLRDVGKNFVSRLLCNPRNLSTSEDPAHAVADKYQRRFDSVRQQIAERIEETRSGCVTRIQGGFKIHGNGKGADPDAYRSDSAGICQVHLERRGSRFLRNCQQRKRNSVSCQRRVAAAWEYCQSLASPIPTGGGPRWSHGTGEMGLISEKRSRW